MFDGKVVLAKQRYFSDIIRSVSLKITSTIQKGGAHEGELVQAH